MPLRKDAEGGISPKGGRYQSDDLVVIAPEHLRKEICEVYRKALERNGGLD